MKAVCVDTSFLLLAAICILLFPLKWVMGAFLAAMFHECCHLAAIWMMGGYIQHIRIGLTGAVITMNPITNGKELLCAAAGPLGSFLLIIFSRWMPELAMCGLFQGVFNLLPVYPLDGGRIMKCIVYFFRPNKADYISAAIGIVISVLISIICISWGFWPALFLFTAFIKISLRKIPCKEGKLAVQ